MALEIAPGRRLVDPYGGREDLARGSIRFLHPASPDRRPDAGVSRRALRQPPGLSHLARSAARDRRGARRRRPGRGLGRPAPTRALPDPLGAQRGRAVRALESLGLAAAIAPELAGSGPGTRVASAERIGRGGRRRRLALLLFRLDGTARRGSARRDRRPAGVRRPGTPGPLRLARPARESQRRSGSTKPCRNLASPAGPSPRTRSWPSRRNGARRSAERCCALWRPRARSGSPSAAATWLPRVSPPGRASAGRSPPPSRLARRDRSLRRRSSRSLSIARGVRRGDPR